ncbi:MAG: aldo/keto reductase [Blastocatellia bacterium]|jgi:predicted aldo/keto reductase-like oxidoreductase
MEAGKGTARRPFDEVLAEAEALARRTEAMQRPGPAGIPLRPLGKTGEWVTMIGVGGWDSVVEKTDAEAVALLREAFDLGITFWDNAWEYHEGRAEAVMGRALVEGALRDDVFLMTKVCARDAVGFRRQLDDCLRRLRTDQIDLVQLHSIQYPGDRERYFDPATGAMEAALEALEAGKFRYLGFSGHMDPGDHQTMLDASYEWATVQMPINLVDAHKSGFQHRILRQCVDRQIGPLGMKSLGGNQGRFPAALGIDGWTLRRYAMSMPVSSLICGMQTREELLGAVRLAQNFAPLQGEELRTILSLTRQVEDNGQIEEFKVRGGAFGCSYHGPLLASSPDSFPL